MTLRAFLLLLTVLSVRAASPETLVVKRIDPSEAPILDGKLDPIWKKAGTLRLPDQGGNYYKKSKADISPLPQDIETPDAFYRPGKPFTIAEQNYAGTDPSSATFYFMHDGRNLYVAVVSDDREVEGSDYDQTSDGFGMALKGPQGEALKYWLTWYRGKVNQDSDPEPSGPPLDRERMCYDAEWRSKLDGTWNEKKDRDRGYVFEFFIPLEKIGGAAPGDAIAANLFFMDHDGAPGAVYNAKEAAYLKSSWGSIEDIADLSVPRKIVLEKGEPAAVPGKVVFSAKRISPANAPRIDGILDDSAWSDAPALRFPNPAGESWTMSKARYNEIDPSQYEIKMLYDDTYLYVAFWSDDRRIESSPTRQIDVDQESDGLTSLVIELPERARTPDRKEIRLSTFWHSLDLWGSEIDALRKAAGRPPNPDHFRDVDHDGKPEELHFQSGPPRAPYALDNDQWGIQWAPSPLEPGEWNNAAAVGKGYAFEYRIPLRALGWPEPGEPLRANVVLADHDGNPQGRYNDFKTRYASFWWGTDKRELWEYDGKGKPMKPLPIPASKERAIALAPSDLAGSLPGRPGTVLSHFDEARGLESDRPMRFIAGYAGKAARIQGPATITVPCSGLDAAVVLQFLARCDAPAKMSIAAEDASGNRTLLGERLLDPADLRDRPERWHRVALPVGALGKNASKIRKVRVMIESGDAALDEMSALDAEDVLSNTLDFLAGQQLASSGLVRSFVGTQPAHTYDQAVALLAFTEGGRETEARRLAKAMVGLQEKTADQGFFYDSYSALDSRVGQGTDSGVGPNAWMALALARYGSKYHDLDALKAADRVCRWLLAKRSIWVHEAGARRKKSKADEWTRGEASLVDPQTGAVWAAITHDAEEGAPTRPDIHGHDHDRMLFWYSTEGVIDAEQLFDFMNSLGYDYRTIADKMREWMFRGGENSGWNRLGRFNVGHNDFTGNDERLYLDCQTWGAILAQMHGDEGKATLALETARQMISTRSFQGTTIRGFNDSRYPENDSIWFGGTAHYVAACSYLKDRAAADPYVATLLETQRISGGWPHSSDAAYTTCFVRKSDGKVVLGYVDEATGIAYDDPAHLGEEPHRFDPKKYPEPEWTGYGSYHNAKESVGETAWVYFALKGFWSGQPLPYPPAVDRKAASK